MNITIDAELKRLIPALLPEEFMQLEANILRDGCKDPLSVWKVDGKNVLVDGHNRHRICEKNSKSFQTVEISLEDRDHAKLWIGERQLGRRNISDSQRAVITDEVRELRSGIAMKERAVKAGKEGGISRPKNSLSGKTTDKLRQPKKDHRKSVAKEFKVKERDLRTVQETKKRAPELIAKVRSGEMTLPDAKKLSRLEPEARKVAVKAVEDGKDVRTAIRDGKKEDYNKTIAEFKPKALEGTYRIIYADPPWKYVGLNQADEYGHAERHYDCLDDNQLCAFKVGGTRTVKSLLDDNAVLFLWVTSPLLERSFAIMSAWGFDYKTSFVWDKVKHNMGHYNSVRHELLLIGTKGSCKPDVPKLVDSVQSIERSNKHSQKPEQFYDIIEGMYSYGRKLELFSRTARVGWDTDGNQ